MAKGGAVVESHERWTAAWAQRDVLLRMARSRVQTWEDAEDIVAEAIRRAGCQEDLPLEAVPRWLTTVTINLCVDRMRRLATQNALLARAELRPEAEPSHEEQVTNRAEAVWLTATVDQLPDRQAQALRLRAAGHGNPAIAQLMGLTVASVEGLLKRSRAVLREVLRATGMLVAAFWVRTRAGRRLAAVASVGLAVSLLVLPSGPAPGLRPGRGAGRIQSRQFSASAQTTRSTALGSPGARSTRRTVRPPQVEPQPSIDLLLGRPPAYDGPHCLAVYCLPVVDDQADRTLGSARPEGWTPRDVTSYFGDPVWAPQAAARKPTVVIVSDEVFPWIADDLAVYRSTFHLPACGTLNGCLRLVTGPDSDSGVRTVQSTGLHLVDAASARTAGLEFGSMPEVEQAQLLEGVSAACPECRLVLVRGASASGPNLAAAFRLASRIPAEVMVTNLSSYNGRPELQDPGLYGHRLVIASGGELGFTGATDVAPLSLPTVIGVGGTQVVAGQVQAVADTETYCNTAVPQPSWQAHLDTGCPGRAGVDVAAPGAYFTGLSVYISGGVPTTRGWYHPGHDVQAAAIVAGLFARHHLSAVVHGPGDLYRHPEWFADIVHGDTSCATTNSCQTYAHTGAGGCLAGAPQICHSRLGWDGPAGLGEPRHLPWL